MNILGNSRALFLLILLISSCNQELCADQEGVKVNEQVEKGNVEALRKYLENGGDPAFECYSSKSGTFIDLSGVSIASTVRWYENYEINKCYLEFDIPQDVKNENFEMMVFRGNDSLIQLYMENGAILMPKSCALKNLTIELSYLRKFSYDFKSIDYVTGKNLLMKYCSCPATEQESQLIRVIDFLLEQGIDINTKDNAGNNAYDLAPNPKIKEYIKELIDKS